MKETYDSAIIRKSGMQTLSGPQFFWMLIDADCEFNEFWSRIGLNANLGFLVPDV